MLYFFHSLLQQAYQHLEAYAYISNVIGGGKKSFLSDEQ